MISVKNIITFLISITFLAGINSAAQQRRNVIKPDQYRAFQWTMENGLSWNYANVMIKDVKGFLWVGSILGGF